MSELVNDLRELHKFAAEQKSRDWDERDGLRELFKLVFNVAYEAADLITALEAENKALREGLEFYANPQVYMPDSVGRVGDLTFCARALLAKEAGK